MFRAIAKRLTGNSTNSTSSITDAKTTIPHVSLNNKEREESNENEDNVSLDSNESARLTVDSNDVSSNKEHQDDEEVMCDECKTEKIITDNNENILHYINSNLVMSPTLLNISQCKKIITYFAGNCLHVTGYIGNYSISLTIKFEEFINFLNYGGQHTLKIYGVTEINVSVSNKLVQDADKTIYEAFNPINCINYNIGLIIDQEDDDYSFFVYGTQDTYDDIAIDDTAELAEWSVTKQLDVVTSHIKWLTTNEYRENDHDENVTHTILH